MLTWMRSFSGRISSFSADASFKEDNFGIHFEFKDIWVGGGMGDVDIFCGF